MAALDSAVVPVNGAQEVSADLDPSPGAGTGRAPWSVRGARLLLESSARCPLRWLQAMARGVAMVGAPLPMRPGRVARANVALCFPELAPHEQRRFVRRSLAQAASMVSELGHFWLRPVSETLRLVVEVSGEEHLERALARGKGLILASPHLGAWELAGLWFASRHPMTTLYRPPRVPELEPIYGIARRRSGATLVSGNGGVRALCEALARGEIAALLPDQDPGRRSGVFAPFFGVPANTSTLLPRIAARSRAPVLFTFAERLPRGAGYRLHIRPGSEDIASRDFERAALALNQAIEACVRQAPEQYLWTYKRFRTRPDGQASVYPPRFRPFRRRRSRDS